MTDIKKIAENADMIVNGYPFTRKNDVFRVLNLKRPEKVAVITSEDKPLETSMD